MVRSQHSFRIAGTRTGFEQAAADLRAALDESDVHGPARARVELVFEEIVTNVIRHGSDDGRQPVIDVLFTCQPDAIAMRFDDDGRPFDPLERPEPARPLSLATAPLGGLGIMLVRKASSAIAYERTEDGKNRLTVTIATR